MLGPGLRRLAGALLRLIVGPALLVHAAPGLAGRRCAPQIIGVTN